MYRGYPVPSRDKPCPPPRPHSSEASGSSTSYSWLSLSPGPSSAEVAAASLSSLPSPSPSLPPPTLPLTLPFHKSLNKLPHGNCLPPPRLIFLKRNNSNFLVEHRPPFPSSLALSPFLMPGLHLGQCHFKLPSLLFFY